jgi:hypothetical protein
MNNLKLQYGVKDLDITLNLLSMKYKKVLRLKDISLSKCVSKYSIDYDESKENIYIINVNKDVPNYKKYEVILNSALLTHWLDINGLKFNRTNILKFPLLSFENDEFDEVFNLMYYIYNDILTHGNFLIGVYKFYLYNRIYTYFNLIILEYYFSQFIELNFNLCVYKNLMIYYIDGKSPYDDSKKIQTLYNTLSNRSIKAVWSNISKTDTYIIMNYASLITMSNSLKLVPKNDKY